MTAKQLAEAASSIRTGFGTRQDFDEPRELVFSESDPIPAEEAVCPDCDSPMIDGECENCAPAMEPEFDDDDCRNCHGTGEGAFGHRCDHGRGRLLLSKARNYIDPDAI